MTGIPIVGFGKVEANLLSAVLDTADVGTLPDLVPLGGTVTFASRVTLMRTDSPVPAAVFPRKMTATIDEEGWIINPVDQTRGIWLPLGLHDVTYNLTPTITVNPHSLEVLPTHTEESPANLLNYMNMGGLPLTVSQFEELSGRIDEISLGGVVSVNGVTGDVVLSAASVGALPDTYVPPVQTWGQIPDKPTTFTPTAHVHAIANVTGLQAALDGKQPAGSYAPLSHTHTIANVSGLQAALDGKQVAGSYAASVHTHSIANVSGLQASLDSAAAPQTLTLAGSDLSLSGGGGTVTLPAGGGGAGVLTVRVGSGGLPGRSVLNSADAGNADGVQSAVAFGAAEAIQITALCCGSHTLAGAGGVIRAAVYHMTEYRDGIGTLVAELGTVPLNGGNAVSLLAPPIILEPGWYWLVSQKVFAGSTMTSAQVRGRQCHALVGSLLQQNVYGARSIGGLSTTDPWPVSPGALTVGSDSNPSGGETSLTTIRWEAV